jgi:hypothetical protein
MAPLIYGDPKMAQIARLNAKYAIFSLALTAPVYAQDVPYFYNTNIDYSEVLRAGKPGDTQGNVVDNALTFKPGPTTTPQSMSFTPIQSQRKRNIADYVSSVAKIAPEYAPQLAAELADGAVFDQYSQMLGSLGLNANDVGDNLAVWWITAWEASSARSVDTPPAAFTKVKAQVARILSEKALTAMSNTEKQRYADSLTIQTMVLANQIEQAKSNPDFAQQLAKGIKADAKKIGFDLDAMTLTENGFVPVKGIKTGAADDTSKAAHPAVAETAVAANTTDKGDTTKWALIAAAGGAGLAGVFLFGKAMGRKG